MSRITLTNMGVTFIGVSFIFTAFLFMYGLANDNGYSTDDLNETIFNELGDPERVEQYINDTKSIQTDTQADTNAFDVIGQIISTAFTPVRIIIQGANFLITNLGKMINFIGIPSIVSDYVTGLLTFIIGSIFLFAVILARRDKND